MDKRLYRPLLALFGLSILLTWCSHQKELRSAQSIPSNFEARLEPYEDNSPNCSYPTDLANQSLINKIMGLPNGISPNDALARVAIPADNPLEKRPGISYLTWTLNDTAGRGFRAGIFFEGDRLKRRALTLVYGLKGNTDNVGKKCQWKID